jgi:hypothetical protein
MKTRFTPTILVGSFAVLAGFAIPRANSNEAPNNAATALGTPAQVVVTPALERYLVLDTSRVPVGGPPACRRDP